MRLFHSTNEGTRLLRPMHGPNRHSGEAEDAVGDPVVWLSSQPMLHLKDGNPYRYRYEVEVAEDDADLTEDESVANANAAMLKMFGAGPQSEANRYFYLRRPVEVVAAEKWDDNERRYVPSPDGEAR